MDRRGVAVFTHIEFQTSVVIIFLGHLELEFVCFPFGTEIDRRVGQVTYPPGVRRRDADDTFSSFICPDVSPDDAGASCPST